MLAEKLESWSRIIAAIFIPIAIAYMGNEFAAVNKRQESQARLVELATNILSREVTANQTVEQRQMRRWAVDVINAYSGVPMDANTQQALITTTSLPKTAVQDDSHATWAVVFGSDTTRDSAQYEVTQVQRRYQIASQIYLRSGSYRSVALAHDRSQAEDFLGQLKQYRGTSYIVDMSRWCPNTQQQSGYLDCRI